MCCFTFAMHIHEEYNVLLGDWLVKVTIAFSQCNQFAFLSVSSKLRVNKNLRQNFKPVKDFFYLFFPSSVWDLSPSCEFRKLPSGKSNSGVSHPTQPGRVPLCLLYLSSLQLSVMQSLLSESK